MPRVGLQYLPIQRLRLRQPPLLMQADGVLDFRQVNRRGGRAGRLGPGWRARPAGLARLECAQFFGDPGNHAAPVTERGLAEQAGGRIPRAVFAVQQPAPIGIERQQQPHRLAQHRRQMGDRRVHRDDQIQVGDQCGGVGKIAQFAAVVGDVPAPLQNQPVGFPQLFLQADELQRADRQPAEFGQRYRAVVVVSVRGVARPRQADTRQLLVAQSGLPCADAARVGAQINPLGRNRLQPGLEGQRQAQQRALAVKGRQRFAPRKHPAHAFQAGQQRLKLGLRLQPHRRAQLRHPFGIAAEL